MRRLPTVLGCVLVLVFVRSSAATAQEQRGWLDVNLAGASSNADEFSTAFALPVFREVGGLAAAYDKPGGGAEFDIGGGYMFTSVVGLGVSLTGQAHQTAAGLGILLPHPYFFNATATATGVTGALDRAEAGFHIQAMINATPHSEKFRLRVFGGPSYISVEHDVVEDIGFAQFATPLSPVNLVSVTGFDRETAEGGGWGYHVGTDVSFFFTRVVGLGAVFKYSRATAEIDDPLSELSVDLTTGGAVFGGGLRLRF